MRKKNGLRIAVTAVFLIWNFHSAVFSAPSSLLSPALSADSAQIGVVAAVRGTVKIGKSGKVGEIVKSGRAVYLGDEVSTDEKGNLQVLLLDETVFTIGPNSSLVIDKFIYDPSSQSGKINAKIVKGTFRFVTGKIARKTPSDMQVDLPSGTIGVRGTIVAGQSQGSRSLVVLLGPGSKNNTVHKIGQITVGNESGGKTKQVNVTRPGFGSVIEGPGAEPTPAFKVPAEQLNEITGALGPSDSSASEDSEGEGSAGSGSDASEDSGQDTAAAGEQVESEAALNELFADADKESAQAAQDDAEDDSGGFFDGITTVDDLDLITTGVFHYKDTGVALTGGAGTATYTFDLDIDFGDRTFGGLGANNKIDVSIPSVSHNANYIMDSQSFDEFEEFAVFEYTGVPNTNTPGCPACSAADIQIAFLNGDGNIANTAAHSITFSDNTTQYEGSGISDPRTS